MSQWPEWLPLSDRLRPLSPYGAPQLPADAVLNTNENPFTLSDALASAIASRIESVARNLNRYPDRDATVLRSGLADFINSQSGSDFSRDNIWAANGSNEIIQSLFLAFGERVRLDSHLHIQCTLSSLESQIHHGAMGVAEKISRLIYQWRVKI
jgi:histidinol-phosphate aminotransferase